MPLHHPEEKVMAEENIQTNHNGNIQQVDIDAQMRDAYLDYAMSVIVARALPDARDGLKPVHRRILYAMQELGLRSNSSYKKSARIVGEVLGKFHPHGDSAVYETMARMAQDFSMRYPLVDGQGNFGSVDGDAPAAMRYTEARLHRLAEELLADIDKDTVDFGPNFDDSLEEPLVLPARVPNMLLNGTAGIAVGMATNIPPHNLRELTDAIIYLIDNYDEMDEIPLTELMQRIPGPDFPTGGIIVGREGIESAYGTGKGRLVVRGVAHIEESKGGRHEIVITEIPYQVNKASLIERIAELVREDRIDQISDLRDESDQRGMSIVIELKRGAQPKKVLNQLYKYTALQSTFGVQLLALVDGEPRTLPLKRALQIFIEHRQTVIVRRTNFELAKARARQHILDGYLIALANLDAVIKTIRESQDADEAKGNLVQRFKLSELQAQAILDMQLRRLAALERSRIEEEHKQVTQQIAHLEDLLAHPKKILGLI
jgi:DNA gyrase subunit A